MSVYEFTLLMYQYERYADYKYMLYPVNYDLKRQLKTSIYTIYNTSIYTIHTTIHNTRACIAGKSSEPF